VCVLHQSVQFHTTNLECLLPFNLKTTKSLNINFSWFELYCMIIFLILAISLVVHLVEICPPFKTILVYSSCQMSIFLALLHSQSAFELDLFLSKIFSPSIACASSTSYKCIWVSHNSVFLLFKVGFSILPLLLSIWISIDFVRVSASSTIVYSSLVSTMTN